MSEVIVDTLTHSGNTAGPANITLAGTGNVTVAKDLTVTETLTVPEKKLACPGTIIQVLQDVKTDAWSGDTTFSDITGLSQAITPSFANSKILVRYMVWMGSSAQTHKETLLQEIFKVLVIPIFKKLHMVVRHIVILGTLMKSIILFQIILSI